MLGLITARRCSICWPTLPASGSDPLFYLKCALVGRRRCGVKLRCRRGQPSWFGGSGWRRATMYADKRLKAACAESVALAEKCPELYTVSVAGE